MAGEPETPPEQLPQPSWSGWRVLAIGALVVTLVACGSAAVLARFGRPLQATPFVITTSSGPEIEAQNLRRRAARAASQIDALRPSGVYVVVDSYRNRLHLFRDGELVRTAICSTGTGIVLRDPRNGREWVFDTPLGERVIQNKRRNPVWAKPDWAFIEEGELPPTDPNERFDDVSLGDYGLYMGEGYIIHGTLFKSLLGRRVTHGCIRLGDEDLEFVYKNVRIGTRVFLY